MGDWSYVWGAVLLIIGILETRAILNRTPGDTISEQIRAAFRTHTTGGRLVFLVAWVGFAAWMTAHILLG